MVRTSCLLAMLSAGCTAPATVESPSQVEAEPDTEVDTSAPTDTGEDTDPVESIEGIFAEGICTITLECDGPIVDEPKVGCEMTVETDAGEVAYAGRAGLDLRGRSSASFPKPQYAAELWDESDTDVSANLLEMGGESDWILNGAYIDRVLFRNRLAYDSFQAARAEHYGPESRYCTLTLDGDWVGIYLLTERVKRDDDRVDLAPDDSGETFIVKLDDESGLIENTAGYGNWQLVYPRSGDASPAAQAAIAGYLAGWHAAALSDPHSVPDFVDVDSMIDFILLQEMTRNNDAYFLSVHLSRAPGEPMRLIPWDSDLTLGQPSYNDNENPEGFISYRPDFIAVMSDVPGFDEALVSRWEALRAGEWSDAALSARMDAYRTTLGDVVYDNFEVWPIDEITFGWSGVNYLYPIDSYDAEHDKVRGWLAERLDWMDDNIDRW